MLEILLQILIIIGYTLLILLGITVILLLVVLYFPVSYRFHLEKEANRTEYQLRFRWLFGLLTGHFDYPEPKGFRLYLFGKPWNPMKRNEKKEAAPNQNINKQTSSKNSDTNAVSEPNHTTSASEDTSEAHISEEKETVWDKFKAKLGNLIDKISSIRDTICYYYEIAKDESTHNVITLLFGEIVNVIKYLKPKKKSANLLIGTGSPDTTGYLCGLYGMFASSLGPKFIFTPDFTRKVFEGTLDFRGNTNIFVLIMVILRIYKNKEFSTFMQKIKKKKAEA